MKKVMTEIAGHRVDASMWSYIARHAGDDALKLMLRQEPGLSFDKRFAVLQVECRHKLRRKIPELLAHERFLFPKAVSAEQCTHQEVAKLHASLFDSTHTVLDLTMGLGVDDYYIASRVRALTAVELDPEIAAVGQYNFGFLNPNVKVLHADSVQLLKSMLPQEHYDAIFVDPARRGQDGRRLYGLSQCQPDVLAIMPLIARHCRRLVVKASPMLDLSQSRADLGAPLAQVWAVSVKNECKELLFVLDFDSQPAGIALHALNYDDGWHDFATTAAGGAAHDAAPGVPVAGGFLYEPHASVMKLGCHAAVQAATGTAQLAPNSHLYAGDRLVRDFPGRKFVVKEVIPFNGRQLKQLGKRCERLNIATRNFRLTPEALKKRLKVGDGGSDYLFATTLADGSAVLLLCEKI